MRRKIVDRLWVGTVEDCKAIEDDPDWAIVHACKFPCHAERCGAKIGRESRSYLSFREGNQLFLNMIDLPKPLFPRQLFDAFLAFMGDVFPGGSNSARKHVLIHCNQGESRAPSLALLFLAKRLFRVSNASYDEAWDEFEKLIGTQYCPSQGIEDWLRENWGIFDRAAAAPTAPAAQEKELFLPAGIEAIKAAVRDHAVTHFAGFTQIEDKENVWITPSPNAMQFAIYEAYDWCMANNVPCRLQNLKPRQVGSSTCFAHLSYYHMRRYLVHMMLMGDVLTRTVKVYKLFNGCATHDAFAKHWEGNYTSNTIKGVLHRPDGTECLVEQATALDPKAGIAGTRQIVWLTEAARYKKTGNNDKKVITAVLNSLANVPKSLGIAESTPEGANGWFYENWQGAVTLKERKRGVIGNGWIKIFTPWFAFPEHSLKRSATTEDYFAEDLSSRERRGVSLYGWKMEQIAWRRMKIVTDCANDEKAFDQDFAEDPESCFLASGRARFNLEGLTRLEKLAQGMHSLAETGIMQRIGDAVSLMPSSDGNAYMWVAERPKIGCSYIAFVDPCTGEQSEGSAYPDAHAPGVIRAGYFEGNTWIKPRLAAVIDVPTGCRWDDEVLAAVLKMACDWYGGCMIVPETGNGLGLLSQLKQVGCVIYQREKMDHMYPGQRLQVNGWETNKDTRPLVVNELANYIREGNFDCEYLPAIQEMKTFVVNSRGKAEAKSGCHDDWPMGIGIGLFCLNFASVFSPPKLGWTKEALEAVGGMDAGAGLTSSAFS